MFRQTKRRTAGRKNFETGTVVSAAASDRELFESIYHSKLSFYSSPPVGEITLDEFETWGIDRLKILSEIESCQARNKTFKETESIIKPLLNNLLPLSSNPSSNSNSASNSSTLEKLVKERKKDYYSHFILRLCFCRSSELRDKFLKSEIFLFKLRFQNSTNSEQQSFIKSLNLPWEFITAEEKAELSTKLFNAISPSLSYQLNLDEQQKKSFFENENFIKIPFELVSELVSQRCIFIKNGTAYVPQFQQLNLLVTEFSKILSNDLIKTSHSLPRLDEDDRLLPILTHLSTGYSSYKPVEDYNSLNPNNEINAQSVNTKKITNNFPLCARNLLNGLNINHHLKYTARQQFSLFLKGIGLSLDDALEFWSKKFTENNPSISLDKFDKEYRYNIRHTYGKEGGKINYKPWDCKTILSKPRPTKDEFHGCPYRDLNIESLTKNLNEMGINDNQDIISIVDLSKVGKYTTACTKVFEILNKDKINEQTEITHPNLYFERSKQLNSTPA